jgi:hypothetical protein
MNPVNFCISIEFVELSNSGCETALFDRALTTLVSWDQCIALTLCEVRKFSRDFFGQNECTEILVSVSEL